MFDSYTIVYGGDYIHHTDQQAPSTGDMTGDTVLLRTWKPEKQSIENSSKTVYKSDERSLDSKFGQR